MSIKETQVIERESLNRGFVSKNATGTQMMAGSMQVLGSLTINGTTTLGSLSASSLNTGGGSITTTGAISGGSFSGSGAGLTSLNASNLASGTVSTSRLPSTVFYTNTAQTITGNTTISSASNLYFASGTMYKVSNAGDATFRDLALTGTANIGGNRLDFGSGSDRTKVRLTGTDNYVIGVDTSNTAITIGGNSTTNISTRFYATNSAMIAELGNKATGVAGLDSTFYGNVSLEKNLDIYGELKTGGGNEFPDPFLARQSAEDWSTRVNGTVDFDKTQVPSGTGAQGSLKLTATAGDMYARNDKVFSVSPGEWVTFSAYLFSTTSGKTAQLYIQWVGTETSYSWTTTTAPTSWGRISVTAQAPSTATSFRIRVDNDGGAGTVMYFAGFQVERGRALTGLKGFVGGDGGATLFASNLKLGNYGEIHSAHNDNFIIKDHANGNVTLSAAGANLYLGHQNTTNVLLSRDLTTTGGTKIVDTAGRLFYQGDNTDTRYLRTTTGGIINGDLTIEKDNAWLTLDSPSAGADGVEQAAGISIGESGYKGAAALHLTYTGSGTGYIGMGSVNASTSIPQYVAMKLYYTNNSVQFYSTPDVNGSQIWHAGNQSAGSGLDADMLDGLHGSSYMRTDANTSTTGDITLGGSLRMGSNVFSTAGSFYNLKTSSGDLQMGMQNTSWAHFKTSATAGFYFYSNISINGSYVVTESRTLTAGSGLTGGGTLAANRSFAIDTTWLNTHGDGRWVNKAGDTMNGSLVILASKDAGSHGGGTGQLHLRGTETGTANVGAGLVFGTTALGTGAIGSYSETGGQASYISLSNRGSSGLITERMRINSSGNMGLGTTSPTQALHVSGNVRADQFHIGTTRKDNLWDSAYTHSNSNGSDHSYINQSVTTAASPTFQEINLKDNHYTNKWIGDVQESQIDGLILLCRADVSGSNNHVAGRIYGRRISGNTHSALMDVIVNSTTSTGAVQVSGYVTYMSVQNQGSAELVSATYGGVAYAAIRMNLPLHQQFTNGIWFSGQAASSGPEFLKLIATSEATNVTPISSHHPTYYTMGAKTFWPGGDSDKANTAYSHSLLTNNPHGVTTSQIGAVPTGRTLTGGTGVLIGGSSSAQSLASNRTITFDTTWGDGRYALSGHNHSGTYLDTQNMGSLDVDNPGLQTRLFTGSSGSWTNRGPTQHNGSALLSMHTHSGTYLSQLWFDTGGDDFYHRGISNGTMRPWSKVWTEKNFTPGNYSLTTHNHDSRYVNKSGDTMTGKLTASAGMDLNVASGNALNIGRVSGNPSIQSSDSWLIMDSGASGAALNYYTTANVFLSRMGGSLTGIGTTSPSAKLHIDNDGQTGNGFYANTGMTPGTQTLFEHKLNSMIAPYRIQKSGYTGSATQNTVMNFHTAGNTVGLGSNVMFTANSSTGVEREYGGIGAGIETNTNAGENGKLMFHTMRGGALTTNMTLSSEGNLGLGTTPNSYRLNLSGDAYVSGWVRVGGTTGLYFQSYGGGWHMTDSTWIRAYGSKPVLADRIRTPLLEVGAGTAAAASDFIVSSSSLNYRNTLYANATNVGINRTNPDHYLDVLTATTLTGINLQGNSDSLSYGYSLRNVGGTYSWLMAREGTNTTPDLVFRSGGTAIGSLSERVRFTNSGRVGIGKSSPSVALDVEGDLTIAQGGNYLSFENTSSAARIYSYNSGRTTTLEGMGDVAVVIDYNNNQTGKAFSVRANGSGAAGTELMRVEETGQVGIGVVPNTSYKLDVNGQTQIRGNLYVTGNLNTNGTIIGMGNDTNVIVYNDSNNISRTNAYTNADSIDLMGDGSMVNTAVRSGNFDASDTVYAHNKVVTQKYGMEYNATEDSLDFVYYG